MFRKIQGASVNPVTYMATQRKIPKVVRVEQLTKSIIDRVKPKHEPNESTTSSTRVTQLSITDIESRLRYKVGSEEWADFSKYYKQCAKKKEKNDQALTAFNRKREDGTITRVEKQQRLNLIRQINSRNYRIQNKLKEMQLSAFIRFSEKLRAVVPVLEESYETFLGSATKESLQSLDGTNIAQEDLLKTWAPPNDWNDLLKYKAECMKKYKEDVEKRQQFEEKIGDKNITKAEKEQRLKLIRQINSRDYRIEKKVLIVLQQAYIKFILAQECSVDLMKEHEKIIDGPQEIFSDTNQFENELEV